MGLASIFKGLAGTSSPSSSSSPRARAATNDDIGALDWRASDDRWISARPTAVLLAENEDLIGSIKLCYGAPRQDFDRDILSLIRRYADFVGGLPCTQNNFFSRPGGLLRAGLEIGFRCLQGADSHVLSIGATIAQHRALEPRWRRATFIAGLCSLLHRTMSHVAVVDNNMNTWPVFTAGLGTWLESSRAKGFMPQWTDFPQETRGLSVIALAHVVPRETMQYLSQGNSIVIPHLFAALSGLPLSRDPVLLHDLVRRSTALVIDRDLRAIERCTGRTTAGAHLERYVLDAMRKLVATNAMWQPNQERSRVWYSNEGLFVLWPNSAAEVRRILEADPMPGIPSTPEEMSKILASGGVLQVNDAGGVGWNISPPPGKSQFEALRFSAPDVLLAGLANPPTPLSVTLLVPQASACAGGVATVSTATATTEAPSAS